MSTINKTFLRVLLAIACCIALAFSLLPQCAPTSSPAR
jgi:hypothetical protein